MIKKIRLRIQTVRRTIAESLFQDFFEDTPFPPDEITKPEKIEMITQGVLKSSLGRIELKYAESELSGMEGTQTSVSFAEDNPRLITVIRSGTVDSTLIFEEGTRHICQHVTPLATFDICVHTLSLFNTLAENGKIVIEYNIEIRGASAEHCSLTISVLPMKTSERNARVPSRKRSDRTRPYEVSVR